MTEPVLTNKMTHSKQQTNAMIDDDTICAIQSTSSQGAQTTEELNKEQETTMREWIMSHVHTNLLPYFNGVNKPWDRTEVLLANIKRLNYNDIILKPSVTMFGDISYQPYFKLFTLAGKLGYEKPGNLYLDKKPLHEHKKYYLPSLIVQVIDPPSGDQYMTIIPDHLNDKSDRRRNECIYIDIEGCRELLSAAMRQPKFKDRAKEFNTVINSVNDISNAIISKLNHLVAEYRHQHQLANAQADKQKLLAIEQKERDIADRQKKLEEETKLLALKAYPDVDVQKSHYGYIFTSPYHISRNLYKIGITDNLKKREIDAHTYCPDGKFYYTVDVYDSRSTETVLHQVLKKYQLHYKINSGDEWFRVPGLEEAKKLVDMAANNTNDIYEHVSTYAAQLRSWFSSSDALMITDRADADISTSIDTNAPPINEFINDVLDKLKDSKTISKTNLIKLLKIMSNDDRYKKHKDKLPIDMDEFITKTDGPQANHRIKLDKKTTGKKTTITVMTITIDDSG